METIFHTIFKVYSVILVFLSIIFGIIVFSQSAYRRGADDLAQYIAFELVAIGLWLALYGLTTPIPKKSSKEEVAD